MQTKVTPRLITFDTEDELKCYVEGTLNEEVKQRS